MRFKCQCCGFERDFNDGEEAFHAGWDAPPHITGYVSCDLCPGVCAIGLESHSLAHAYWQVHGRPTEFDEHSFDNKRFGDVEFNKKLTDPQWQDDLMKKAREFIDKHTKESDA